MNHSLLSVLLAQILFQKLQQTPDKRDPEPVCLPSTEQTSSVKGNIVAREIIILSN